METEFDSYPYSLYRIYDKGILSFLNDTMVISVFSDFQNFQNAHDNQRVIHKKLLTKMARSNV
jgi:hypothetical protein